MPWIQNVSFSDVEKGFHIPVTPKTVLISIVDHDREHPVPFASFQSVHKFKFDDVESENDPHHITTAQAQAVLAVLEIALTNNADVVVHCMAGLCRSGAVADFGVQLGFADAERRKIPNLLVKHKLQQQKGWTYD